jgi:predicted DsbA family dithiol-disulfide isomerase
VRHATTERSAALDRDTSVVVDVHFDFICPWCLIGKRNLDVAVGRLASLRRDVSVKVRWHSHQLLPDMPVAGMPYQAFYLARLGSEAIVTVRRAQVQQAAREAGVELRFERIEVMPNTRMAHKLVAWATTTGAAVNPAALIERLFTSYFIDGEDIGNPHTLERIGLACGLDAAGLAEHIARSQREANLPLPRPPQAGDVMGVPHFVVNSALSLSGLYTPGAIVDAMLRSIDNH